MRPLRLEMQAFGPYLQKQILDFRDLKDQKVFLIHGPTGAGKTSLFDAMAYALYGRSSGDRPVTEMRSKHAPLELATEVVFDFAIGSEFYRARRQVKFREITRGVRKGELDEEPLAEFMRLAPEAAGAEGFLEIEAIAHLDSKVTAAVTEKIGLGVEQFLQVIVLPQGKFRQFLAAKSHEREEILKALFKTDQHKRLQERLDHNAKGLEEQLKRQKAELRGKAGLTAEQVVDPAVFEAQFKELDAALLAQEALAEPVKIELARLDAELGSERQLLKRFEALEAALSALELLTQKKVLMDAKSEEIRAARRAQEVIPAEVERSSQEELLRRQKEILPSFESQSRAAELALTQARADLAQAEKEAPLSLKLQARLNSLGLIAKKLEDRDRLTKSFRSDEETHKRVAEELKSLEARLQRTEADLPAARKNAAELKAAAESHILFNQALREKESLKSEVAALRLQEKSLLDTTGRITAGLRVIAEHEELCCQAQRHYEQLDDALADDQASQLAHRLKDGEPCGVCGSTEHPRKATSRLTEPLDREKVKLAQAEWKAKEEKLNRYKNEVSKLQTQVQSLSEETLRTAKHLAGRGYCDDAELERQIQESCVKAAYAEQSARSWPAAEKRVREFEDWAANARKELDAGRSAVEALATKISQCQGQLEILNGDLKDEKLKTVAELHNELVRIQGEVSRLTRRLEESRAGLERVSSAWAATKASCEAKRSEIASADERLKCLNEGYDKAWRAQNFEGAEQYLAAKRPAAVIEGLEREVADYRAEFARVMGQRDDAEMETQGRARPEIQGKEARKAELTERQDSLNREIGALRAKKSDKQTQLEEVFVSLKAIAALELEFAELKQLALVANGHGGNRYNMSFQRYVQSIYFEDVLQAASLRLEKMSDGRYNLKRSEELGKGNASGGLDLVVEDRWHGTERPASTLSGGEGFMASLSLALALSQIVQEGNGAIRMDAIFIDEGFGTLDEESLRRAIDTLMELHQQGRMVGIISHVPELKQLIPARIEVSAHPSGSEARIWVN